MTEEYKIIPNNSVGPLYIKMRKDECESFIGEPIDSFKRTIDANEITLVYKNETIHISFDEKDEVIEILLFPPNKVSLNNIQLLERNANEVYSELSDSGIILNKTDVGMYCKDLGVHLVEIGELIDSVEIFNEKVA